MKAMPEPADEPGPPVRGRDDRLEDVVRTIQEFASLRFDARATVGPDGDIVDAVAAGVNFLGEELEASFSEIERRVADRTSELAILNRELDHRALHDALTGLMNRTAFWQFLSHRLALSHRRRARFAVLFLDVDALKTINDTLGHAAGDQVLVDVATRLRAALRGVDIAARVGGDEFVVLLDSIATTNAALVVAERMCEALRAPYVVQGDRLSVAASIGVAVGPAGFGTADEVVAAADAAMYDAKRQGGGRYVLYRADRHGRRGGSSG